MPAAIAAGQRLHPPSELVQSAAPNRLLWYALIDWAAIATVWILWTLLPKWLYPVWAVLLAGRFHSFGVILHDAVHMPMREKTPKLRVVEILVGYPIGSTIDAMRYHHLRHHRDSGMPSDPYFKAALLHNVLLRFLMILRTGVLAIWWTLRGPYGTLASFIPALRQSYAVLFLQDRSGKGVGETREVITCAREDRWQLLFHGAFLLAAWPFREWLFYAYFIPVILAGILAGNRLIREHTLEPCSDRNVDTVWRTTNDHNLGWLGQVLMAPRNIGFHREHHLHPQAALEHLPHLRRWYQELL
jgi:fatty acid desaturase